MRITVYDVLGREVVRLVDVRQGAGRYAVTLEGGALPPGVYFYRVEVGPATATRMLVRR